MKNINNFLLFLNIYCRLMENESDHFEVFLRLKVLINIPPPPSPKLWNESSLQLSRLCLCMSVCLSVCVSICLSVCLSISNNYVTTTDWLTEIELNKSILGHSDKDKILQNHHFFFHFLLIHSMFINRIILIISNMLFIVIPFALFIFIEDKISKFQVILK